MWPLHRLILTPLVYLIPATPIEEAAETSSEPNQSDARREGIPRMNTWARAAHTWPSTVTQNRAGQLPAKPSARVEATLLDTARDWRMQVDQRLIFPPEIITTNLRPDLVLWSTSQKLLFIVELTVPWEAAVGEAYERKRLKYSDKATEAEQRGWHAQVIPVEVGCRGFVATSTTMLLKGMGVRGQAFDKPSNH
ncbi:hypothetical protein N1851_034431 [Merluccius polli]|uniref:Uncharacterized protein n=1 Tax=Merluccius polli TaxID=89951 RepID=A0AA47LZM1_MERPO|nr:hypothetical protein N1851_034431 [Merluccius polli]